MPARIIRTSEDMDQLIKLFLGLKMPITVSWQAGADRSHEQNALQWIWASEVAQQLQDREPADVQAEWKLTIGIPILRADDPDFRERYDRIVRPLTYEQKIGAMLMGFPVTSIMKVRQMCRFMNEVQRRCSESGLQLTEPPEDLSRYHDRYGRAA